MAIPHAFPGVPVDLLPADEARTTALVKNDRFEVIRLALPRGGEVCHEHQVAGPITVQCLAGRAEIEVEGTRHDLSAGRWLYLEGGAPHTLRGVEDSLVLLTILFDGGAGSSREVAGEPGRALDEGVIAVRGPAPEAGGRPSTLLAKTSSLELRRLTLAEGQEIPTHHAAGEITVHCLEGAVRFTASGTPRDLRAGQLLVLAAGEPHSLVGLEASTVLVTKVRPAEGATP